MLNRKTIFAAAMLAATLFPAVASASAPTDKPVPSIFTTRSLNAFKFYKSTSPTELFYVPKSGGVRLEGDLSNPLVDFAASTIFGTYTPFLNKPMTAIGATLTTSMHMQDFDVMQSEARAAGFSVTPAPIADSSTQVLLKGIPAANGRVQANCTEATYAQQCTDDDGLPISNPDGTPKMCPQTIPVCTIADPRDPTKTIRADVFIDYDSISAASSDVDRDYSFQGTVHPANAALVPQHLKGGAWDDVLKVNFDWTISQEQTPRYAEIEVNWKSVFTQLWAKAALHNFACVDIQLETMIRDVSVCDGQPGCGVKVHWFDDNGNELPPHVLPPGAAFGDLVNGIVATVKNQLAQTIVPQLGDPGDVANDSAIFVVKANFQRISVNIQETLPVYYFPKAKQIKAATGISIKCLNGNVGSQITWSTSPACRAALGQTNIGPGGQGS